jgi:hypothetical protein
MNGPSARLDFPDDLHLCAEGVVVDGGEADQVLGAFGDLPATHAASHIGDHVTSLADYGELPLFGDRAQGLR